MLQGSGILEFTCTEYGAANCTGTVLTLTPPPMSTASTWNATPTSTSGTLSSFAQRLNCTAYLDELPVLGAAGIANFDNLFFTTDVIFANDFE